MSPIIKLISNTIIFCSVFFQKNLNKTLYFFSKKFTNQSLFYLFLITFSLISLEIKIFNLGINISDIDTKIKFKEVGKFFSKYPIWERSVPQGLHLVNFENCIITVNGIEKFDINLMHTTISNYQNVNNDLFIKKNDWDLWVKLLKENPKQYLNINLNSLLDLNKTYKDLSFFRSYFIMVGCFLIFSDFALRNIFI